MVLNDVIKLLFLEKKNICVSKYLLF